MKATCRMFITYAHEDDTKRGKLRKCLAVLIRNEVIQLWDDTELIAGDKWRQKIAENLEKSDMLLYLVSAASLASTSCNQELLDMIQQKQNFHVIPIILESCDWLRHEIVEFEILPHKGKPINKWSPRSDGWQNVTDGIANFIKKQGGCGQPQESPAKQSQENQPEQTRANQPEQIFFQFANFCFMLKDFSKAIENYTQVLDLNPNLAEAYYNRGNAKLALEQYPEAIKDFDETIKLNSDNVTYNNRGAAKLALKKYPEAIKDFDKAKVKALDNQALAEKAQGLIDKIKSKL